MPRELEDRAGAGAVNLELVDKRGESYEAPGVHRLLRRRPDAPIDEHVGHLYGSVVCQTSC